MSPRKKELNEQIRESRRLQILDAALTVYVRFGYNGADMDAVAAEAGLAKGLVYYYYKTKQELFRAMFQWALSKSAEMSDTFFASSLNKPPLERLVRYIWDFFIMAGNDARVIQFAMRMPFDAYAVFGPEKWREGAAKSNLHRKSLETIIQQAVDTGAIKPVKAGHAANCFWAVFISNLFIFTRMIGSDYPDPLPIEKRKQLELIRDISTFCFQGLGLEYDTWGKYLEHLSIEGGHDHEGL
ncbi:MAG: TetR/AcrR family transcriptional regulator [Ruminiclostridium sp.]|nr:TetR/AcrR family transcriptional regulator [Ruminiclostridium sp.]